MSTLFFFYTIAMLTVCIVTAVLSLAAAASTRRRFFLCSCGAYICYAIELTEIFLSEYLSQNQPFPLDEYYVISMPVLRTLLSVALNGCVWRMILDALDKHSKRLFFTPLAVYGAVCLGVAFLLPDGALKQWLYYTLRQVFTVAAFSYAIWYCRHSESDELRVRFAKLKKPAVIALILVACIVIEDAIVILVLPPSTEANWLSMYLSERNFSENILMVFMSAMLLAYIWHVLSIRIQEAPSETVPNLEQHIDELLPFYRKEHGLSEREAQVLRLVVMKKTNQEIADELVLAVGTIKTHVHNLVVKTGAASRDDLIVRFWQS